MTRKHSTSANGNRERKSDMKNDGGISCATLADESHFSCTESLLQSLITKEIALCAKDLQIDPHELNAWINHHFYAPNPAPYKTILHMLRTAREQQLDPLQEEVQAIRFGLGWQVHISMEGWLKLLHRHPHFSGITFTPSPEETPLPTWMECTIYRSDRAVPTTVREYYQEVKQDAPLWDKMPRRMLRHRTLQQCARVALGVGTIGATGDDSVTNDHCPVDDLRMNPINGLPTLDRDQPEQPQAINLSPNAIPSKRSEHNTNPSSSQTDRLKSKLGI